MCIMGVRCCFGILSVLTAWMVSGFGRAYDIYCHLGLNRYEITEWIHILEERNIREEVKLHGVNNQFGAGSEGTIA